MMHYTRKGSWSINIVCVRGREIYYRSILKNERFKKKKSNFLYINFIVNNFLCYLDVSTQILKIYLSKENAFLQVIQKIFVYFCCCCATHYLQQHCLQLTIIVYSSTRYQRIKRKIKKRKLFCSFLLIEKSANNPFSFFLALFS